MKREEFREKNQLVKKRLRKEKIKAMFKNPLFYLGTFQIITSLFLIITLCCINVLGLKLLISIILLIGIIDFLVLFFLYKKKGKKTKITLSIISGLLSVILLITSIVLIQVFGAMNNMFKNKSYVEYSVLTLKKSDYKKIKDIDNKIVGYYVDDKYNEAARKVLKKEVDTEYAGYTSINELKNALITKEIDAVMIMSSLLDLDENTDNEVQVIDGGEELSEISDIATVSEKDQKLLDNIKDFDKKSHVIYTFKVKVDNSKKTKDIDLEKGSFAVYVSGQDSYASSVSETSRSDVNLLMIVNIKSKEILLLSIPRDYYITINSKGAYDKLTHISLYGSEEAMDSLGALLDVDIDYFVKFNFTTFMKAVEYLLPLDVYSDYDFTTGVYDQTIGNSYTFSKGYNHITDGKMALQFVRARKNFAEGDRQRGINQSRFLRAVINKTSTPSVLIKYKKILKSLEGTFLTNISDDSIKAIIKYVLNNNGSFNISSMSLGGFDANRPTYSGGSQPLYVMIPDDATIDDAKIQIQRVLDGKKPEIEQDASELADVNDTHTVTYKDIGNSYVYVPPKKKPSNKVNKTPVKEEEVVEEKENTEEENVEAENNNDNSTVKPSDENATKPSETTPEVVEETNNE